jgi:hypothetical protein
MGLDFRKLFETSYGRLRAFRESHRAPGLALVAVGPGTGAGAGAGWVGAAPGTFGAAVLGHHRRADVLLSGDPAVAGRHLLVIATLVRGCEVRARVLDLRTDAGFADENGRALRAATAEGPLFVRCGGFALFGVVTGDGLPWPERARDGWECLPQRVWLREERLGDAGERAGAAQPAGALLLRRDGHERALAVDDAALAGGVLLGRHPRCDARIPDLRLSRIHAVLIGDDAGVHVIDAASTNGTALPQQLGRRSLRLEPGVTLDLAGGAASVTWRPVGAGAGARGDEGAGDGAGEDESGRRSLHP